MKFSLVALVVLCGCSSIIEGRSQEIVLNTNPAGASCTLLRNGSPIGTVSPTPSAILVEKTKYDILIRCNKEGFQEATYMNKSGAAGATFGNIVLGGGIGWAVDSATGSDNKYDSPVNLSMVPLYAAAPPATPAASAAAPVVDASTQARTAPATEAETAQAPAPVHPDFPPPPR